MAVQLILLGSQPPVFTIQDAVRGCCSVWVVYWVDSAHLASEMCGGATQALIAAIISAMPRIRITRFRL